MAVLTPLGDCLLIDPEPVPEYHEYKRYERIVVPEKYEHGPEDRPVWGKILAVGSGCRQPLLRIGVRVVFGKWAPARIKHEEKEYILLREDDLLAIDA